MDRALPRTDGHKNGTLDDSQLVPIFVNPPFAIGSLIPRPLQEIHPWSVLVLWCVLFLTGTSASSVNVLEAMSDCRGNGSSYDNTAN